MPFSIAFPLATLAAGTVAIFTDWFFMGVLFHSHYNDHPEVWRPGIAKGEDVGAIVASSAFGYIMTAAVIFLCGMASAASIGSALVVAALIWLAGSLPILLTNYMFFKMDWHILVSHCLGYLARALLAGLGAAWLYGGF